MRKYGYQYSGWKSEPRKESKLIRFLTLLVVIAFFIVSFLLVLSIVKIIRENLIQKTVITPVSTTIQNIVFPTKLQAVVEKSLEGAEGTYAVSIKNLKTGESYNYNQNRQFQSASLYKLWVLATTSQKIQQGKLDQFEMLSSSVEDLNKAFGIASEDAELKEGSVSARITDAMRQMIVISSNYSALLLVKKIGLSQVSAFLDRYGLYHSRTGSPPMTTAADIERFYEELYAGQLADKKTTANMLKTLKDQQLNDRIPKYLPEEVEVAHKTGELSGFKHDAGIVYAPNGPYIIVLLSETKNERVAAEREAKISKAVYDYFQSRK